MKKIMPKDTDGEYIISLFQYDTDVTLDLLQMGFSNDTDNANIVVEFSNINSAVSIQPSVSSSEVRQGTIDDEGDITYTYYLANLDVDIPDTLLTEAVPIYGYIYDPSSSEEGRVDYWFRINVIPRAIPSEYIYDSAAALIGSLVNCYIDDDGYLCIVTDDGLTVTFSMDDEGNLTVTY